MVSCNTFQAYSQSSSNIRTPDLTAPDTQWNFCPEIGPAYLFAVFFGLTTIGHTYQAIRYRKPYCWVIILSGLAQTLCYIFRILSIKNPTVFGDYAVWFILILVRTTTVWEWTWKWLTVLDCPSIHKCVCIHGHGEDGLEFYILCQDLAHYGMENGNRVRDT